MGVTSCYLCATDPVTSRRYGGQGLAEGQLCPICHQSTCRYHLTTVRWRWRESGETDAALVCQSCKRAYAHRHWDSHHRDWIT
ncbi:MAG: hypothetical protein KC418_06950 [Anaerolineales bacterium]|nr:hypothetical protein [Anaerolineales bacterium]MCB8951860.1 hypothetical protein [Ardenticatenales bacterium]